MSVEFGKLVSIASAPLCLELPLLPKDMLDKAGEAGKSLNSLLYLKNGFYAFEGALHVLPSNCQNKWCIEEWNAHDLWKSEYGGILSNYVCFAEDIFGEQFAINSGRVYRFDPETGGVEAVASSLEEWSALILDNYETETGYPLAHEWHTLYGSLPQGQRLLPKIPFVLGGDYAIDNLYPLDAIEGMKLRADIWRQIKGLPSGTQVKLKIAQ
jgi:hypothetical protein